MTLKNQMLAAVAFERGFPVWLMAIDGTWRRSCRIMDVSETGARLIVESSIEGINLKGIFPAAVALQDCAFRRCEFWLGPMARRPARHSCDRAPRRKSHPAGMNTES